MDLTADRLAAALDELDPGSRALLDLSLRRGYGDVDVAKLMRTAPAEVAVRRANALERVGDSLGLRAPGEIRELRRALGDLPADAWTASGPAAPPAPRAEPAPPPAPPKPEPPPARASPFPGTPGSARGARPRWALVGLGMLVVAALAVLIIVLAGSNETSGPAVAVRTVAGRGADVHGTARLKGTGKGARLELNVSHLPDPGRDYYEVWLFDSVADAVPLGRFNGTRIHLDRELPKDPARYRWIDISLEPPNGNPNHSGESVARVKLSALRSG